MRGGGRAGFTVVEALVSLLLLLIVLGLAWSVTAGMGSAAAELADRGESLATSRATTWILQEELSGVRAPSDLSPPSADTFSLRAFRGTALVCGARGTSELLVRWSGIRSPDPSKDSVLVLAADGGWSVRSLTDRIARPGACPGPDPLGGVEERWTLGAAAPGAVLLRVFERGSYHLSDDALRYRIGAGGRQPLTPGNVDPSGTGLSAGPPAALVLRLATRGAHRGRVGPEVRRSFPLFGRW